MASQSRAAADLLFEAPVNLLNPRVFQQSAATNDTGIDAPAPRYPAWLTDPHARGLETDWTPSPYVRPADPVTGWREMPGDADAPMSPAAPAPQQQTAVAVPAAQSETGGGGFGGAPAEAGTPEIGLDSFGGAPEASADAAESAEATGGFASGGVVTRNRLVGPDPRGPDDGYAALNAGEGVITARAMKYYGKGFLSKLNRMEIPKK